MALPARASWPLLLGLLILAGLGGLDAAWGERRVITTAVVVAPFATALFGRQRETFAVAAAALLVTLASPVWNDNLGDADYFVRVGVVVAGAAFAILGVRTRERLGVDRDRFRLLSAAAALGDTVTTVDDTIRRVTELLIPEVADVCAIDVERAGQDDRRAIAYDGPLPGDVADLDEERRIAVELRAGGRRIGTLTLAMTTSGRRYDDADREFVAVLAGRIALALANAGLSSEVESLEAQLSAALGQLAEAVTIQDTTGTLIYANQAAADALGFATPEELLATPVQEIVDGFDSFLDDGSPMTLEALPGRKVLAGEHADPVVIRAIDRATGEERWRITKATAVLDADGRPALAVNVIEDVTEVKRAEMTQRFLAQAGEVLASSLDYEVTLKRVTELVVPELADWCSVALPDGAGFIRSVAVAHVDPDRIRLAQDYNARFAQRVGDPGGSAQVLREGVAQVVNDIPDELLSQAVSDPEQLEILRGIGMRAAMIVPMVAASGVIGVISFISAESGRPFSQSDVEIAEELGRRAGAAVENARLYAERSRIAQTLQAGLLPEELPAVPGFDLAALYRPAGRETFVGGDFYDALSTDRGWLVLVGDVTGRGAEAAALTAEARHTLRTAGVLLGEPLAAVAHLNRALVGQPELPICTVAVAELRAEGEAVHATIVCAGHPQPLLVRGDEVRAVGAPGPMVGAWADAVWRAETVEILPGDVLVLYTDGVIDAVGEHERFGEERLARTLRGTSGAANAVTRIRAALEAFERGDQADDTAVLALERT